MKVSELMDLLDEQDPNAEVRLAIQPSYPFQHSIGQVVAPYAEPCELMWNPDVDTGEWYCETHDRSGVDDGWEKPCATGGGDGAVVYIAESGQHRDAPYLPGAARDAIGW